MHFFLLPKEFLSVFHLIYCTDFCQFLFALNCSCSAFHWEGSLTCVQNSALKFCFCFVSSFWLSLLPVLTLGCQLLFCYSQSHSRIVALSVFACFHLVSSSYDGDGEGWCYRWLWVSWCGCWELNWGRVEEHVLLTNESFFSSMLTVHCFRSFIFERLQKVMWLSGSWQHLLLAS